MARSLADARRWMQDGTGRFLECALSLRSLAEASLLPGWSRAHVLAHVALNAEAIGNLVHWAATGDETPMYASPEARHADIERGSRLGHDELRSWATTSAETLESAMAGLDDDQWSAPVVTAHGRTVPAAETPWLRAREVMVHAVDLGSRVAFSDLPTDFLESLVEDAAARRGLAASSLPAGPLPEVAAWLTGRPHALGDAPELGRWL